MNTSLENITHAFVFDRYPPAEAAVQRLVDSGVARERIGVLCSAEVDGLPEGVEQIDPGADRTVPQAVTGTVLGSLLGGLGIVAGTAATGGAGLFVAGPLLGGSAVLGGLLGAMSARGAKPEVSDFYEQALRDGQVLVLVDGPRDERLDALARAEGGRAVTPSS